MTSETIIPSHLKTPTFDLLRNLRQQRQTAEATPFWLHLERRSMLPLLQPGDEIEVMPVAWEKLKRGDIIVYERQETLVAHRLVRRFEHWALTKGDELTVCDPPVPKSAFLGKVIRRRRAGVTKVLRRPLFSRQVKNFFFEQLAYLKIGSCRRSWGKKQIVSLNLAGVPVMLIASPELASHPRLKSYEQEWSGQAAYAPWLIELKLSARRRPFIKAEEVNYALSTRSYGFLHQIKSQYFHGQLDLSRKRGTLQLQFKDIGGSIENFLRIFLAWQLPKQQGMLLHAAAVVRDERAHLFVGQSGAGKSTVAMLSEQLGDKVMSDDLVALVCRRNQWFLEGLPFKGSHPKARCASGSYPLTGIYSLVQSHEDRLETLSASEAFAKLIACVPFMQGDPQRVEALMPILEQLLQEHPLRRLHFRPQPEFWRVIST